MLTQYGHGGLNLGVHQVTKNSQRKSILGTFIQGQEYKWRASVTFLVYSVNGEKERQISPHSNFSGQ